jgi:hypothetical protein
MYALVVACGVSALAALFTSSTSRWPYLTRSHAAVPIALVVLGLVTSASLATLKQLNFGLVREGRESVGAFVVRAFRMGPSFTGLLKDGYGMPCGYDYLCERTLEQEFERLGPAVQPGDIVLSALPAQTVHYLGRTDAWLFTRLRGQEYPTLSRSPTDEYIGAQIIDTTAELRELTGRGRVWVIASAGAEQTLEEQGDDMWQVIRGEMTVHQRGEHLLVYVSTN